MEPPAQPLEGGIPEPAAEPAVEWTGPSQDEWNDYLSFRDEVNQAQQAYEQQLADQQAVQEQQQAAISWLDPESHQELDRYLDQKLAPLQEFHQQAALQEGDQRALDILESVVARDGDFLFEGSKEKARVLANNYFPEAVQRYGYGPAAAEKAIEQAAKDVREYEQQVGKAYYDREVNQLRGLANAPREPGAAGTGAAQQHLVGGLGNVPGAVTSRYFRQP